MPYPFTRLAYRTHAAASSGVAPPQLIVISGLTRGDRPRTYPMKVSKSKSYGRSTEQAGSVVEATVQDCIGFQFASAGSCRCSFECWVSRFVWLKTASSATAYCGGDAELAVRNSRK